MESERLRVIPDLYPVVPGHTLVVTRAHLACLGAADQDLLREVEETATRVAAFLERAYGTPPLRWENGVAGQTVFHAHLHLIPAPRRISLELDGDDWRGVAGIGDLPLHYSDHGEYHYAAYGDRQVVVDGSGPSSWHLRLAIAREAGVKRVAQHFVKATSHADVDELGRRWRALGAAG